MNNYIDRYINTDLERGVLRKLFNEDQDKRVSYVNMLQKQWFFDNNAKKVLDELKKDPEATVETLAKRAKLTYTEVFNWTMPIEIDLNRDGVQRGIIELRNLWRARELFFKMSQVVKFADSVDELRKLYQDIEDLLKEESIQSGTIQEQIQAYEKEVKSVVNVEYPFPTLQKKSGGLRNGQVHVIGGESGSGKSLFAMAVAVYAVLRGKRVYFFSTEMTQGANFARALLLLQSYCGLTDSNDAFKLLSEANNFVTFDRLLTIEEITAEVSKNKDADFIVIDHLQDMDMSAYEKQYEAISNTCMKIKSAAIDLDIPILLVSQLNRASGKKNIDQERFLGSGKINQIAHLAMILEAKKNDQGEDLPDKTLHIVKNRGVAGLKTGTGRIELKFDNLMRLVEIDNTRKDVEEVFKDMIEDPDDQFSF